MAKVNTSTIKLSNAAPEVSAEQLTAQNNKVVSQLESKRKTLAERYKDAEKVTVSISPFYRPYFGNNMPIGLNGITVYVPVDGHQYMIPKQFAQVLFERIAKIDAMERKSKQRDRVKENFEQFPGQKDLISAL